MEVKDKVVTVEGLKGAYDNLNGKISSNDTDIANLQNSVTQLNSDLLFSGIQHFKSERTSNLDDFNGVYPNNNLRILYGIIDNIAYISFDVLWVRIQFSADYLNLRHRVIFGDSEAKDWQNV